MSSRDVTITLFNGKGDTKTPYSPYNNKTFIFISKKVSTLKEAFYLMSSQYSLSKPLNIMKPIQTYRRIEDLKEYKPNKIYNIAIDLDEINTKEDYLSTIEYFANNKYSIILGKSKGWNGVDKFNLKGILRVNLTNNEQIIIAALTTLQANLGSYCKVDLTAAYLVSLQAPSNNNFIVLHQEKGKIINDSDVYIEDINNTIVDNNYDKVSVSYDNEVIDECISLFSSIGYTPISNSINDNGSLNFRHPSEVRSKGGYFWYPTNPLVMNHNNKNKSLSIFHLLKNTDVGKKWLKNKTKEEQEQQLIKQVNINNYKKFLYVNERYLDFTLENKGKMLDDFLDTDKGVFKLKSAMGTAKSSGIDLCIKKVHDRNEKVLIVSNRVSVALDFSDKYNIMLYKHLDSGSHNGSLVVQYDSLHRYDISKYDVIIFDEFTSLLLHHRANLTDNANINAVMFKIIMDSKRVLIADAFLTGYEDTFFTNREIFAIFNEYKDDIKLFEYKNKEYFISNIVDSASKLEKGQHISASFTSLNVLRVTEMLLRDKGIKVISLTSETSQITREIIYKKFKEDTHGAFEVILFTPTLTVGVSNLNNITKHYHYDSGMSTDVISSLQMVKRSRTTKEIHYLLEERQFYYDTDISSINNTAEKNINNFYNKKDKTLLIDICYTTGKLKLTPLAKYINEIEVYYNVLANNHCNAFKLLLQYQFNTIPVVIDKVDTTYTIKSKVKIVKDRIKKETLDILESYSNITWDKNDIDVINTKISELTKVEKVQVLMSDIQDKFKTRIPRDILVELIEKEINSNFTYISNIKSMNTVYNNFKSNDYARYILSKNISSDIASLQNKGLSTFLTYMLELGANFKLQNNYSRNNIKEIDIKIGKGKKFEKFLKKIGYNWSDSQLRIDDGIFKYLDYL